jgi:hypothetical protein
MLYLWPTDVISPHYLLPNSRFDIPHPEITEDIVCISSTEKVNLILKQTATNIASWAWLFSFTHYDLIVQLILF